MIARALIVIFLSTSLVFTSSARAEAFVAAPACPPIMCGAAAGQILRTGGALVAGGTAGSIAIVGGLLSWGAWELTEWFWESQPPSTGLNERYYVGVNEGFGGSTVTPICTNYQQNCFNVQWSPSKSGGAVRARYACNEPPTTGWTVSASFSGMTLNAGSCPANDSGNSVMYVEVFHDVNGGPGGGAGPESGEPSMAYQVVDLRQDAVGIFTEADCLDGDGDSSRVGHWYAGIEEYQSGVGGVLPPLVCPAGTRLSGAEVGLGVRVDENVIIPKGPTVTAPGLGSEVDLTAYPLCANGPGCDLRVDVTTSTGTQTCTIGNNSPECVAWPTEDADPGVEYECLWGTYSLPLGQCAGMDPQQDGTTTQLDLDPACADPYAPTVGCWITDVEVDPGPTTGPTPTVTFEPIPVETLPPVDPDTDTPPVEGTESDSCASNTGWLSLSGIRNAAQCALAWAFVPQPATVAGVQTALHSTTTRMPLSLMPAISGWMAPLGSLSGNCPDWSVTVQGNSTNPACYPWFVSAMTALRPAMLGAMIAAGVIPLVWSIWRAVWPIFKPIPSGGGSG